MREKAFERIGHLYPKAKLPDGGEATVIAWLWARTVPCPNPVCGVQMPLMRTFQASRNKRNPSWIKPVVNREDKTVSFVIQNHNRDVPNIGTVNRNGATCVACKSVSPLSYVRQQSTEGKLGEQMTAVVTEGDRKRIFVSPTNEDVKIAQNASSKWRPTQKMPTTAYKVSGRGYGITHWHQLFTERQLASLTTFSDLIQSARKLMLEDGAKQEYANAVCTYLALIVGRDANIRSSFAIWHNAGDKVSGVFGRQAIPMVWDFPEGNPIFQLIWKLDSSNWMGYTCT